MHCKQTRTKLFKQHYISSTKVWPRDHYKCSDIHYLTQYFMPSFCLNSVPVIVCGALRTNLSPAFCITSTFLLPFNCLLVPYLTTIISMWLYQYVSAQDSVGSDMCITLPGQKTKTLIMCTLVYVNLEYRWSSCQAPVWTAILNVIEPSKCSLTQPSMSS